MTLSGSRFFKSLFLCNPKRRIKKLSERFRLYNSGSHSAPCGSRLRPKLFKDVSTDPPTLRKVGDTDQQALIDSFRDQCDIERIVSRYLAGDFDVLQRVQGLYTDVSGFPADPVEAMNLGNLARSAWENLTPEQQKIFGTREAFAEAVLSAKPSVESESTDSTVSYGGDTNESEQ